MTTLRALARAGLLAPRSLWALVQAYRSCGGNIAVLLDWSARRRGASPAIADGTRALTYADLQAAVEVATAALSRAHSLRPGDRVALIGRSTVGHVVSLLAIARLGCDLHLLSPDASIEQLEHLVQAGRFDLLIADRDLAIANPHGARRAIEDPFDPMAIGAPGRRRGGALVVLTGGTSGQARAAARRPRTLPFVRGFATLADRLALARCEGVLIATPLHHGFGLAAFLVALALGREIVLLPRFDTDAAARELTGRKLDAAVLVPTMLQRLLGTQAGALSELRLIVCGGAPLESSLARDTLDRIGPVLHNLFGTSEAGVCVHAGPADLRDHPGTIGRPLPGVRVAIRDKAGRDVATGETGLLAVRSPLAVTSGWVSTGDLAFEGRGGMLHLRGRDDGMIVSGGENIYPSDVETVLGQHPDIAATAVIGVPDARFGQCLHAFVVPRLGSSIDAEHVRHWLTPRVARFQRPATIVLLDQLPLTPLGKIDRAGLRDGTDAGPA